jgi:hypothetical protein
MSPSPMEQDVSDRPTLTLVEEDDGERMQLTKGDWRGLWHRFDQMHRAQQALGEQMGTVRSTVHGVREDMSKVLLATSEISLLCAAKPPTEPTPTVKRSPALVNITLVTLLLCAVVLTGRQMGWW